MKRKEKYRLEQKSAEILQKRLSTENENFFNLVKSLEILDYVEIISVRQENRSTDFFHSYECALLLYFKQLHYVYYQNFKILLPIFLKVIVLFLV